MSRRNIYDNWERLVVAVVRRDELWQLCHQHSRSPSICSLASDVWSSCTSPPNLSRSQSINSISSDISSSTSTWSMSPPLETKRKSKVRGYDGDDGRSHTWPEIEKKYKPGVYIKLVDLPDGIRFVKRVWFTRFRENEAIIWWFNNREKVYKRYNAWGGNARLRSFINFSFTPLVSEEEESSDLESVISKSEETEEKLTPLFEDHRVPDYDISETEKIVLKELKQIVQEALNRHEFGSSSSSISKKNKEIKTMESPEEVFIWGVKLLEDEKTDTVLLKFLRAQEYNVKDAFVMMKKTIQWRKEFGIDGLIKEDLGNELKRVVFMHCHTKQGLPVCYNVVGGFQDKELYLKTFFGEEQRKLLRWRIRFLEKIIRNFDFSPGGVSTIVLVNDLKNYSANSKNELRQVTEEILQLLQEYYPEFVEKHVFINTPWWYIAYFKMISPILPQRTKSMFTFAGPSSSVKTLLKYISAEQIPAQYGGIIKDGDFGSTNYSFTEIMVNPSAECIIEEFPVQQLGTASWEVTVSRWKLMYGAEFVPSDEGAYTTILNKTRKINGSTQEQEEVISGSYKNDEPGKVVVTITNLS